MKCLTEGSCFARDGKMCTILTATYPKDKPCPFRKKERRITNGKYYPYNQACCAPAKKGDKS